jgi:ectoine hydroxylase-related dioxygenase (phytanoyl-CoA dioxygenase family)
LNWLTANTALAGTPGVRQPAHKDNTFAHPLFPYYFIANVPLCEFSRANGATEFWLGSHAATTTADQPRSVSDADRAPYPGSRPGDPRK